MKQETELQFYKRAKRSVAAKRGVLLRRQQATALVTLLDLASKEIAPYKRTRQQLELAACKLAGMVTKVWPVRHKQS